MTEHPTALQRATTRSADGWPRLAWTHHDLDRMTELGLLPAELKVELIGGEIIPMAAKGYRHERLRRALHRWIYRRIGEDKDLVPELGWRPELPSYLEPDFLIVPVGADGVEFPGSAVLLAIEIADSSFSFDTGLKRDRYAALGVPEYWVIRAGDLMTRVHRDLGPGGYATVRDIDQATPLTPERVPEIALRLADLGLDTA